MPHVEGVRPRKQLKMWSCGPGALRTIFYFYGVNVSEKELVDIGDIDEEGTSEHQMRKLSHEYGFSFYGRANGHLKEVSKYLERGIPILICYQDHGPANGENGHYAVLTGVDKDWVEIADPANYYVGDGQKFAASKKMKKDNFLKRWFEVEIDDDGTKLKVRHWFAIIRLRKKK
jgi:ABC-type bacteriocin/lantibiotic exporter with double-glycine peptidase domain